jgi:LysM repeat protein
MQGVGLIFPTAGCWEVTGRVGDASLTFVTEVVFSDGISTPVVESIATPQINATPVEDNNGYDWRGTKLYLNVPLPEVPTETNIYLVKEGQPATVEQTRALAEQFGIQGDVYVSKNPATGETEYLVTDGKQSLSMSTGQVYTYTASTARAFNNLGGHTDPNAEATINEFLASHGFDFPHRVATGELFGGYVVEPLSPEGMPVRYEFFSSRPMKVILDENGQVLQVEANLMDYEQFGTQAYGIISAEEAFQHIMDDNITKGKIESALSSSSTVQAREWRYVYPKNETITIYGYAFSTPALDPSKPAFNQIDGYTVTGNTNGFETLRINSFVQATGLFIEENGIEKFNVDSWKISDDMQDGILGNLTSENGQVLFQTEQGEQLIIQPDLPSDLPMPYENAFVVGIRKPNNIYEWTLIDDRANDNSGGSGGGSGGGQGFYKLNLSGTPVPFPLAAPTPGLGDDTYVVKEGDTLGTIAQNFGVAVAELSQANNLSDENIIYLGQQLIIPGVQTEQTITDLQGLLSIIIQKKTDGTQTTEYDMIVSSENGMYMYYGLEGSGLDQLDAYTGLPIIVSGNAHTENNFTIINVESFTIPYPELQFQIVKGTQEVRNFNGQYASIFTIEGGGSYIELLATSNQVNDTVTGIQGDTIQQEVLIVPNETFYDMPVIRVYQSSIIDAGATPMQITGNRIQVLDDTQTLDFPAEGYTTPTLTIEKVELMYYVTNPHWQVDHLDGGPLYIQPVWRFYGHYDNGGEFEVLVQALKEEYLLPQLAPHIPPG